MRIIHAPLEIAGQVGLICHFLRQSGYVATGYNYYPTYLNYQKIMNTDAYELTKILQPAIQFYDLFHFQNSYTFLEQFKDVEMIKEAGKKMIMHHRGNDVRSPLFAAKGYGYSNPYVNTDGSLPHEQIICNLQYFARMMDAAIVQDGELYDYVINFYEGYEKKVYILPRLIDIHDVTPAYRKKISNRRAVVVHAPTSRSFKGSEIVESVLEKLSKEIYFEYRRIEGMSHEQALIQYRQADIIIDQILCGAYGNLSVEAMTLGKPVICYIRPDLVNRFPADLPIVSANPDTLYDVLKSLIRDPERQRDLGERGRKYVEEHHDAKKVIQKLIQIYQEVLRER